MPLRTRVEEKQAQLPEIKIPVEKLPVPVDANWVENDVKLFPDPDPNPTGESLVRVIIGGNIYDVRLKDIQKLNTGGKFNGFIKSLNLDEELKVGNWLKRWPVAYNPELGEYRPIYLEGGSDPIFHCPIANIMRSPESYTWEDVVATGSVVLLMDLHGKFA